MILGHNWSLQQKGKLRPYYSPARVLNPFTTRRLAEVFRVFIDEYRVFLETSIQANLAAISILR